MWIVFGNSVKTVRVPGGARVERGCGQCGETATFYEKEIVSTFRLYFMDVFDYQRHRVMACGCCGACYATDELGLPATRTRNDRTAGSLGEGIERAARRAGEGIERAASALESGISNLFLDEHRDEREDLAPAPRHDDDDDLDPLDDPLEARFRELERKAGLRDK